MVDAEPGASGSEGGLSAVHARFARAVILIYLCTAAAAVALLVAALATDLTHQKDLARETLLLETEVRAYYLARHLRQLASELTRLGLRSEVNLLDQNLEPERSLLRLTHEKSAFFNVGVAVVGRDGVLLWSEPQNFLTPGASFESENWFQVALRTRRPLIIPVRAPSAKDSLLYMVSPIIRSGQFTGALLGAIDLALTGGLDPEIHPGAHSANILITREGLVIYAPRSPDLLAGAAWHALVSPTGGEPFLKDMPVGNRDSVVAGAPLHDTDFFLLSVARADALFGPARARLVTRLGLGAILALVPIVLMVFLLRRSFRLFEVSEAAALRGERLRMLGEAVNLIAHEVKNALNGLRVGLDLILQGGRGEIEARHRQAVAGLRTEIERLSNFTTELLSFSKGVVPRPVSIDLAEFVAKVTGLAHDTAERLGVSVELLPPPGRVPVRADPSLVHVVIANLVGNALEALAGAAVAAPKVEVRVEAGGTLARVRVVDNGPGVPGAIRSRLFEPFVTGKPSGVGIGLALSRRIARAHGGDLVLEASGPGASFLFTLPMEAS
ncbi:MAG TPA: sensor histidine kinase, partial [Candidatus Polarisedimenticolia bacterium]|nr:sensor histidine kinase [Candidatus Polarisedimenticolia bacterium]